MKKPIKIILLAFIILIIFMAIFIAWKRAIMLTGLAPEIIVKKTNSISGPCSNQYYETEYNEEGKITIKNFPYRNIKRGESCKNYEIMETLPFGFNGVVISEEEFKDLENEYHICYPNNLSLSKISDLSCIQEIELSGMPVAGSMSAEIENCFFTNDNINQLSQLTNLEKVAFNSCSIKSINSN
jgi:hypothetical protein